MTDNVGDGFNIDTTGDYNTASLSGVKVTGNGEDGVEIAGNDIP